MTMKKMKLLIEINMKDQRKCKKVVLTQTVFKGMKADILIINRVEIM